MGLPRRTKDDYIKWCLAWLKEIRRVIKISGSLYIFGYLRNLFYLYDSFTELGFNFRQQIIIDKGIRAIGGRATKGYKMFPNVTESLLFFTCDNHSLVKRILKEKQKELKLTALEINKKLGVKSNGGGMWSLYTGNNILSQVPTKEMWERLQVILNFNYPYEDIAPVFNIEMGITDVWKDIDFYQEKRYHPTQKPIELIERIIKASSNEEMVILDDTESKRQDKFIEMGMSESDAVIERLLLFHLALNGSDLEHLKELYGYLSRDQLVEIFNKRKKQIQERFHNV